jgi:hypothetical protein
VNEDGTGPVAVEDAEVLVDDDEEEALELELELEDEELDPVAVPLVVELTLEEEDVLETPVAVFELDEEDVGGVVVVDLFSVTAA